MSQKTNDSKKLKKEQVEAQNSHLSEIVTCILALPTIFVLVSLITYYISAFTESTTHVQENFFTGTLGYRCALRLDNLFGIVSFYLPVMVVIFVILFFLKKQLWKHIVANVADFIILLPFFSMIYDSYPKNKTNYIGHLLYQNFLEKYIGQPGFILLFVCWVTLFAILIFHISFVELFAKIRASLHSLNEAETEKEEKKKNPEKNVESNSNYIEINSGNEIDSDFEEAENQNFTADETEEKEETETEKNIKHLEKLIEENTTTKTADSVNEAEPEIQTSQQIDVRATEINQSKSRKTVLRKLKDYHLPPLSLLTSGNDLDASEKTQKQVNDTGLVIERKLLEHKIKVKVHGATIGPVVTMYEIELGEGVRVNQVVGMEQDLTVAVGGKKVRVVGYIPGKPYIGIEVPNEERLTIRLKSVLESSVFEKAAPKGLPIALGLDVKGVPCAANLSKMPHVLVAGTTGSGKSVGINTFIMSLLYTLTPEEVKFIMVDPKGNEFNIYEGIPHMLLPVVVDSKKAAKALQWAVMEMDNRFKILAENFVKDITEYNNKIDGINKNLAQEEAYCKKMPYIVVVIDEFADLMMVAGKEVELAVARIAQKARAVGIHLIIATQKPTRDVVTGLIKSNLPVRIAFKVASSMDSRIILDTTGADALLGNGDMLYIPPGSSIPTRIHGAFVSTEEMKSVIDFIKEEAGGDIHPEDILENFNTDSGKDGDISDGNADLEKDPLYDEMLEFITETGKCSASMLQRKFSIGYNRAARAVDYFEAEGIVTPNDGAKPRTVIGKKS